MFYLSFVDLVSSYDASLVTLCLLCDCSSHAVFFILLSLLVSLYFLCTLYSEAETYSRLLHLSADGFGEILCLYDELRLIQ